MILTNVEASGFRNLEGFNEFGAGLNIFYGDNAQGKTNFLEAICVLGTARSFRTTQLRDCISFATERCIVRGETLRGSLRKQIQVVMSDSSKELFANGKRETLSRYLGNLAVFIFSLEELEVIRGEPGNRRRYLDRGAVTLAPAFIGTLSRYNNVIKQKNRLLAEAGQSVNWRRFQQQIETWNDQLIELGTEIHNTRATFVSRLNAQLENHGHGRAIFAAERLSIRYRSSLEGRGDLSNYSELFRDRLTLRMPAEISAGHSLIGPHRDDLEVMADGREVARFGSAGQQRSALLLLDLAQVSIYNSIYDESPVLIIDDIDAELDRARIESLVSELEGRAQTFISTSRRDLADEFSDRASIYLVEGGRAVRSEKESSSKDARLTSQSAPVHDPPEPPNDPEPGISDLMI